MSSIFNQVLILFSTLFNVSSEIVADSSELILNFENKTVNISYSNLQVSENVEKLFIVEDVKRIQQATRFNDSFKDFTLQKVDIDSRRSSVDVSITFSFQKFSEVSRLINLRIVDGKIIYLPKEREKVTASNGKKMKLTEKEVIAWDTTTKLFELSIKRDKGIEKYDNFETIAPYFR
ncbi:hypothetical protein ACE939_08765 [Aquimarina sp. W85]|uniref:hypothetical protein n=1 Tax=Aquimarina rhodophyticola TaxID=3342246 RepID=UPI00366C6A5A